MELYLIWLNLVFNNNYMVISKFLDIFNSPEEMYNLSDKSWNNFNIKENIIERLVSSEFKCQAEKIYRKCQRDSIKFVSLGSPNYPVNLKHIDYPPILLYYKGELIPADECAIAIVGSRKFTEYGRLATKEIASQLSKASVTIVSGMAKGIDSFAHIAAIDNHGRTLAVLGSGINVIYPAENFNLYYKIIDNGAVISEFQPDANAFKSNFPLRNRIVSGLSLGVLVVEAGIKSGSMITAKLAGEQGRDVFAIPGNIFNPNSVGSNNLIKDGAKMVTSCDDILEELHMNIRNIISVKTQVNVNFKINLPDNQKEVFDIFSDSPIHFNVLLDSIDISPQQLSSILTVLELNGYIKKLAGDIFVKEDKYIFI